MRIKLRVKLLRVFFPLLREKHTKLPSRGGAVKHSRDPLCTCGRMALGSARLEVLR